MPAVHGKPKGVGPGTSGGGVEGAGRPAMEMKRKRVMAAGKVDAGLVVGGDCGGESAPWPMIAEPRGDMDMVDASETVPHG
jgi:hypothetical protein